MSGAASVEVSDGTTWRTDGPLGEILSVFNGGSPLNIVNGVKSILTDGFTVVGTAQFMGTASANITVTVMKNGDITLLAVLSGVQLSKLLAAAGNLHLTPGFEVVLPTTSVLIKRTGSTLSLSVAAVITNIGEVVFVAQYDTKWQVAVGFDLDVSQIAALPGLSGSKLASLDSFIGLTDLMMVISSYDDADFDFPDLSSFQAPALGSGKIALPKQAGGKLVEGLNVYAGFSTTKGGGFQSIAKFLKIKLDGSIGITLAVSLPDPETNSKLFLSVEETIKPGVTLTGELGLVLASGEVGVFLTGEVVAPIQGQPAQFDVTALVVENGVLFSGSMIDTAPIHFDIDHVRFHLADVGLVIGIDDEGIPSFGFAATIDVDRFNAALALFIDSTDPSKSMFAAAVTELSLLDVVEVLANQTNLPASLKDTFDSFDMKSLAAFVLPIGIAHALDQRDLKGIAAAFAQHQVTIPSDSDQVLLDVNTPGQLWYLTDLKTMNHYILKLANNAVAVSLEPQLYVAPQATSIGALSFPQGYKVIGQLDLLLLHAAIDIEIAGLTGISADVYVDPIVVHNANFLAITGAGGQGGPYVSLATYARPQETDPNFRAPHFAMSGELRLLGAEIASVYMNFSKSGIVFDLKAYVTPFVLIDLNASFQSLTNISFGGSITIGVNDQFDLGSLGKVQVRADALGSLNIALHNTTASAAFMAELQFEAWQVQTPRLDLDVNTGSLPNIKALLLAELKKLFLDGLLKDVTRFLDWAKRGVLQGLASVEQIAGVLKSDFKLAAADAGKLLHSASYDVNEIAKALKSEFGQTAQDIANFLKNDLGLHSDAVNAVLKAAGFAANEIESALSTAFDWAKSHLNPSHW